ncbi:protein-disulfide reductase DsbD family protein [Lichenihabitans psoromatis]|uniref:protein-disulfide reductase DsbD family protein n=1 Tax=Lichenihabitans psoromatis TaxID=2528642 RepID=UPI001FE1ABAB|nr:protein-disulfide reductase DsbD domain-containing protein [Lichenihabitans psoromatis]
MITTRLRPSAALLSVGLAVMTLQLAATVARAASTPWVGDAHAAVRLITRDDRVGQSATVEAGLEFRFAPGWHGYWRTPGDAGLPPVVDWSTSDNVRRGEIAWPAPVRLVVEGLQNSVYEGDVILPVSLVLERPGEAATLHASVGYAACSNVCVPFQAELSLPLPAGPEARAAEAPLLVAARAKVPGAPGSAGIEVVNTGIVASGGAASLVVTLKSNAEPFRRPDLFVEGAGGGLPAAPEVSLTDDGRTARLTVALGPTSPPIEALTLTLTDGSRATSFGAPVGFVPSPPPTLATAQDAAQPHVIASTPNRTLSWGAALLSALFGGLILNLMPCVLPVLSIKLMGLVRHAGVGRRTMRMSLLATASGVIASFLALAAVLIGLQWSGASLGWGIQFQQPWFLAGMASLTVLFAASLFDWLAIGLPSALMTSAGSRRSGQPLVEAFLTGAFATLLATPCSAPFVGTAVGFALAQGPIEILAVFLCLGVGMALPYGAIAAFPRLVRWVPRPGPWMVGLRTALGFLLLGTAAWLLVVLWSTAGGRVAGAVLGPMIALLLFRAVMARRPGLNRTWITALTTVLVLAPLAAAAWPTAAPRHAPERQQWQVFDPAALPGLVAEGRTVLVDVTATWCLTCKINDLTALDRTEVATRIDQRHVVRMRADWSRPDPAIAAYLRGFGRYGIPMDVVYGPARPTGEPLPELLSPTLVLNALDRAAAGAEPQAALPPG